MHHLASIRLRRRRLVVVDATNVQEEARRPLLELARRFHAVPVAIVLDLPPRLCHGRNAARPERAFGPHVVERHCRQLRASLRGLTREGWRHVYHLVGETQVAAATIQRVPLWTDRRDVRGPFDLIGDVHGCYDELTALLGALGYGQDDAGVWRHPAGRRLLFLGDLVDRGPRVVETANLVMDAVAAGSALCVPGNHDVKLQRALSGRDVTVAHGLAESLAQVAALPEEAQTAFSARWSAFVEGMVSHLWLDGGDLVAAHAGMKAEMIGRASARVRDFALYGETTGEIDAFGLPVRLHWAEAYRGRPCVVYGHVPVPAAEWLNGTIDIDTGCVFGGALTALRWPERELVSVPAARAYAPSLRPLAPAADALSAQWRHDDLLDLDDFSGRRRIETRLAGAVLVAEGNAAAALETISRFAVHPRWLIYLPPTMSPVETSDAEGFLERPEEAFAYFARAGVEEVVCQEKHMGSRAVLIVCRTPAVARRRFGAPEEEIGAILTRTGRPFFEDPAWTRTLLDETASALSASGLWDELETDWLCLDAEILPWNAKAQGLLREQYAPVAAAGEASLLAAARAAESAALRGLEPAAALAQELRHRFGLVEAYRAAYRRYCWPVSGIEAIQMAPFHLMAAEGRTLLGYDHLWQMRTLARLSAVSGRFRETAWRRVRTSDRASLEAAVAWWEEKTAAGGEGMVVKPREFIPPGRIQPAVKARGREYLRIIYGPEYTAAEHLTRLRERGLGAKRALASREFALGVEALERFVRAEPLRRVHECVFGILALESEPVDPRL